jgi:hypothetical protein
MEPLTIVDEGLQALRSWLGLIWPYLLLLPLLMWAWVAGPVRLQSLWGQILEHPLGALWPVPAALLPPFIAFAKDGSPSGTKRVTVAGLLLAIAVIQIYGQLRTKRYKELGDAEISRISAGVNRLGSDISRISAGVNSISAGVNSIGSDINRLAAYLTAEEEESGS